MKQSYLFRFILFVLALIGYLYCFDPSFSRFVTSAVQVSELNFSDKHLLNSIVWVCGFWGILVYLNTPIVGLRVSVWAIFIGATFINLIYSGNGGSISISQFDHITSIFEGISSLSISLVAKFLVVSAIFVSLSLIIKPLSIYTNTWFAVMLAVMALVSILIFGEEELALESVYLVPSVIIHKYLLVGFTYLKDYFKSAP